MRGYVLSRRLCLGDLDLMANLSEGRPKHVESLPPKNRALLKNADPINRRSAAGRRSPAFRWESGNCDSLVADSVEHALFVG